jgi:hypothetical protein
MTREEKERIATEMLRRELLRPDDMEPREHVFETLGFCARGLVQAGKNERGLMARVRAARSLGRLYVVTTNRGGPKQLVEHSSRLYARSLSWISPAERTSP